MKHSRFIRLPACIAVSALVIASCATQRPPTGGDVDAEPPEIVETDPANGAKHVTEPRLYFRFSEYVDRQSFQQSFRMSPLVQGEPQFEWSGKEVEVLLPDTLKPDRTYIVTIGTNLRDVNAGNKLTAPFQIAFSTGDSLDSGSLNGRVFDDAPGDVTLLAYLLSESDDTLNPAVNLPDYVTQTDQTGRFEFSALARGTYRVFALRDRLDNFLYDVEQDDIGIPASDVIVSEDSVSKSLALRLTREDISPPYIQNVEVRDNRSITVRFSEGIQNEDILRLAVLDSVTTDTLSIALAHPDEKRSAVILYLQDELSDTRTYLLHAENIRDANGNSLRDTTISFQGSTVRDTSRATILHIYPSDNMLFVPVDTSWRVLFSQPLLTSTFVLTCHDSGRTEVPVLLQWTSGQELHVRHLSLQAGLRYTLCIDMAKAKDSLSLRALGDTLACINFTTESEADYGSISGRILDSLRSDRAMIRVRSTEKSKAPVSLPVHTDGTFTARKLLPGKYLLEAWRDTDGSGTFSPGKPYPFRPSERFGVHPDTLRVRARWETGGITIPLP